MAEKPRVVISACLNGYGYRYDGSQVSDEAVNELQPRFEFISVCPEVDIGLGLPRKAIRLIKTGDQIEVIQAETGLNLTKKLVDYSNSRMASWPEVDGFILKARSPSCGVKSARVFSKTEGKILSRGDGIFVQVLRQTRPYLPLIDEGRLKNRELRWEFLARVHLHFLFRQAAYDINSLLAFHPRAKYFLMSISRQDLKTLGQILASHQERDFQRTLASYGQAFRQILAKPLRRGNLFKALSQMFGQVSGQLRPSEKKYFLNLLEKYRAGQIEVVTVIEVLRAYAYRLKLSCLLEQYLLTVR
jgi:uncharacterized protein YbbK (DUF523 family)/uncharacterized protein YbgA (DUF1722 family)